MAPPMPPVPVQEQITLLSPSLDPRSRTWKKERAEATVLTPPLPSEVAVLELGGGEESRAVTGPQPLPGGTEGKWGN